MHAIIKKLENDLSKELKNILNYWINNSIDKTNGGFIGERDYYNNAIDKESKGIILNSRILWSFAAASNHLKTNEYNAICQRSYQYLKTHFNDQKNGGVYWELNQDGNPTNTKKQIYAQAFMIYALSEYYQFSKNKKALNWAISLYELIEKHSKSDQYGGYIEAFNEDWTAIDDMRLSDKDENVAKTMNTHLHVLEAYTKLYQVTKKNEVKENIKDLIHLFLNKFLNKKGHMNLFFDNEWNLKSDIISYGHDIETAWLLIEAAKAIEDELLVKKTNELAVFLANKFIKYGIDDDGGVFYEYHKNTNILDSDKHWWVQAEAIVGLKYAYDINANEEFIKAAQKIWSFTFKNIIDHKNGEWHWKVDKKGNPSKDQYKMGLWKAPYHNSRACMTFSKTMNHPPYN